jgi:hypothetical protein
MYPMLENFGYGEISAIILIERNKDYSLTSFSVKQLI